MVPETPPPAFAAVRFFLLARFFLFLPAFFPGAGTDGTDDDTVRNIVVDSGFFEVVVCCCLLLSVEKLTKTDNLSIFRVIRIKSVRL